MLLWWSIAFAFRYPEAFWVAVSVIENEPCGRSWNSRCYGFLNKTCYLENGGRVRLHQSMQSHSQRVFRSRQIELDAGQVRSRIAQPSDHRFDEPKKPSCARTGPSRKPRGLTGNLGIDPL